jgi:hypothetical protein
MALKVPSSALLRRVSRAKRASTQTFKTGKGTMNCTDKHEPVVPQRNRRQFLQLAALGAGASLLAATVWPSKARASGQVDALLLTCMDYRLTDSIELYMEQRGLQDKYDHVVLAGASLGAITHKYPAWNRTFWQHLDIALQLHHVPKVIVVDHRDCGAYKLIFGPESASDPELETRTHAEQLRDLRRAINTQYPELQVETLLMSLDGTVETMA